MKFKQSPKRIIRELIGAPFVYWMFIPCLFFDISLELYHRICFRLYSLPYIKRSQYIKIDRQKLAYLNLFEKFNCMYCGYVNGLLHYSSVIAGETEKYWCGIMHQKKNGFKAPKHHKDFLPFDDKEAFDEFLKK